MYLFTEEIMDSCDPKGDLALRTFTLRRRLSSSSGLIYDVSLPKLNTLYILRFSVLTS